MDKDLFDPPPAERLATLVEKLVAVGKLAPGTTPGAVERLRGGLDHGMHVLTLDDASGQRRVVLRRYGAGTPPASERAHTEAGLLTRLARAHVPAPALLLDDSEGALCGLPAIVIEFVDGQPVLDPGALPDWCAQVVDTLLRVHGIAAPEGPPRNGAEWVRGRPGASRHFTEHPEGERLWHALRAAADDVVVPPPTLVHCDYHPGNLLWRDGRLVAVVDWAEAGLGDPAEDLGALWFDLALTRARDAADEVVRLYMERSPLPEPNLRFAKLAAIARPLPDPVKWLPSFEDAGLTHITAESLRQDLTDLIRELT